MSAALHELSAAIEPLVRDVESKTSAEVVVVIAGTSDHYQRLTGWAGMSTALASTAFFCWSPWVFTDIWIPVDVAVVTAAVVCVFTFSLKLRVFLTRTHRKHAAVALAADAAFAQEAVHATKGRTGLLIYASVAEGVLLLRPDVAIQAAVPAHEWQATVKALSLDTLPTFEAGMKQLGEMLGRHLPRAADDVNESPDTPRVRA